MSGSYREQLAKTKDVRRGSEEPVQRPQRGRKADRKVEVEYKTRKPMLAFGLGDWHLYRRYRTLEEAHTVVERENRKSDFFEYRLRPAPQ